MYLKATFFLIYFIMFLLFSLFKKAYGFMIMFML